MNDNKEQEVICQVWGKASACMDSMGRKSNLFIPAPDRAALVVVDMQNFVCSPTDGRSLPGMEKVVEKINQLVDFCHNINIPVIWLRQNFNRINGKDDAGLYSAFHKSPLARGMYNQGADTDIYPAMHLNKNDHVLLKNRYSAFAPGSSFLDSLLTELSRNQLILCGVATNVCVESTARDAMQKNYQVILASDAATAFDEVIHQVSLINIKLFYGDIMETEEILKVFC